MTHHIFDAFEANNRQIASTMRLDTSKIISNSEMSKTLIIRKVPEAFLNSKNNFAYDSQVNS